MQTPRFPLPYRHALTLLPRRHVRPVGQKWVEITAERECEINANVESLKLVMEVAKKLERRNNVSLVRNKAHCDFIRTAMLEINKLFQEN